MFCNNCGNLNDDSATVCKFCGAQLYEQEEYGQISSENDSTPVSPQIPNYVSVPLRGTTSNPYLNNSENPYLGSAGNPYPVRKKSGKTKVIAAIASSAAVFIAAAIVIIFALNKRSAPTAEPEDNDPAVYNSLPAVDNNPPAVNNSVPAVNNNPPAANNSVPEDNNNPPAADNSVPAHNNNEAGTPTLTGTPAITVNGRNVPVGLAMMGSADEFTYVGIASKTDTDIFQPLVGFNDTFNLRSHIKITSSDNNAPCVGFAYSGRDLGGEEIVNGVRCCELFYNDAYDYSIEIGEYVPNEYIEILISGEAEIEGRTYSFKAGGKFMFNADYVAAGDEWYDNNRIPAA